MKTMKRFAAALLAGVLALAMLTACSGAVPNDTATAAEVEKTLRVYMKEGMPEQTVVGDEEVKAYTADAIKDAVKKGMIGKEVYGEWEQTDRGVVMKFVLKNTVNKQDVDAGFLERNHETFVTLFKKEDDYCYEKLGVHASAADVCTAAQGADVIIAFAMLVPVDASEV